MQTLLKTTQAYRLLKREYEDGKFSHAYLLLCNDARNLRTALKTFAKLFLRCADANTPDEQRLQKRIQAIAAHTAKAFLRLSVFPVR